MKTISSGKFIVMLTIFSFVFSATQFAQHATISGRVTDVKTGEALIGANVYIEGTSKGTAADMSGNYTLTGVSPGEHRLTASYIGYESNTVSIAPVAGEKLKVDIQLQYAGSTDLAEVTVTAQARGQMNAINEQLRARSIKNVVSSERIQELPDANAAETLGRLPGVSVLRNGGEGAKVVVRGLSPKYNKVTIEGISMASSDGDRSTDISMISPYSLDGIEVFKAVTADKDADWIGGMVNFKLREADPGFKYDVVGQMGYNHLKSTFNDYMFTGSVSNRFFEDKLGVYLQGNIEQRNRSSNEMSASYDVRKKDSLFIDHPVYPQSFVLSDVYRNRKRYGATAVIDYKLNGGSIKFMNFFSQSITTTDKYNDVYDINGNTHHYSASRTKGQLGSVSNILGYEQRFGKLKVEAKASHSYSKSYVPSTMNVNFWQWNTPLFPNPDSVNRSIPPTEVLKYRVINDRFNEMSSLTVGSSILEERQYEASLDLSYDFSLSDQINGFIKFGGKYKYKERGYDIYDSWGADPHIGEGRGAIPIFDAFPWMREELGYEPDEYSRLPFTVCDDPDFDHGTYLKGKYPEFPVVDLDLIEEILFVLQRDAYSAADNYPYVRTAELWDFSGNENYYAGYLMSEINIGRSIKFTPGVRYEHNATDYTAANGITTIIFPERFYNHVDTSATRENGFLLPMIHLKYSPVDWFDLRLAYTKTMSRPTYQDFVPRMDVWDKDVRYNNKELVPETSQNYDIYLSFHHNKIGLFTAGGFIKQIDDQIFSTGRRIISDPAEYGFPEEYLSKWIITTINNEYTANVWGLEFDWQTNFWYLPGVLKGIVLNVNYTHIFSEAKYPYTYFVKDPESPVWAPVYDNVDTFYVDQLIDQPDDIINVQIGYDYKGFSTRLSMLYQSRIFKWPNFWHELNYHTASYLRWDLSVRQKLPWAGLEVFCNVNNFTSAQDRDLVSGANWDAKIQEYGMTVDLGVRMRLH
ncbi:MAG: TonB-dependent receptor [Bacteroidota bacterium]